MAKNKLLVVYNTCGFSGREPVDWYLDCIKNILNQDFDGYKVVVSSCGNRLDTIKKLLSTFGKNVSYNFINDRVTVNTSFNHTVAECVKEFGEFEGYLWGDSGVFDCPSDSLKKMYDSFKLNSYGMLSVFPSKYLFL